MGWGCFQIPMPVADKLDTGEWSGSAAGGGMYVRIWVQICACVL